MGTVRQIMVWGLAGCLALFLIFSFFSISLCQIFGFLGLLLGLALIVMDRAWRSLKFPIIFPLLVFSLLCGVAIVFSTDTQVSLPFLKRLLEPVVFFWMLNTVPFLAANLLRSQQNSLSGNADPEPGKISDIAWAVLLVAGIACIGTTGYQLYEGLWLKTIRPYGTLNNAITFGTMLMLVGLALSAFLFYGKGNRVWPVVFLIPIIAGMLLCQTRSAWVGLVAGLVFLLWKKGWKWLMALPVFLIVLYFLLPNEFKMRIDTIATASDEASRHRIQLWIAGWELIKDHPLTGIGFNTMDIVKVQYPQFEPIYYHYRHFHNQYIQFIVDAGVPTLLAWLCIWGVYFKNLWQNMCYLDHNSPAYWVLMAGGSATLSFLVTCLFENQYYDSEFTMLFFTFMAFPYFVPVHAGPSTNAPQPEEKAAS